MLTLHLIDTAGQVAVLAYPRFNDQLFTFYESTTDRANGLARVTLVVSVVHMLEMQRESLWILLNIMRLSSCDAISHYPAD